MEQLNILVHNTIVSSTSDEVCFVYIPNERIHRGILAARYGEWEIQGDGATYSLDKTKLQLCFKPSTPIQAAFGWKFGTTNFFSVAVPSNPVHTMHDQITAAYAPEHVASTVGMTLVHFFSKEEADAFKQHLGRK